MSTPIYTDKDYLDAQFESIRLEFRTAIAAAVQRQDDHDEFHRRWAKRGIALVSIAATFIASLISNK